MHHGEPAEDERRGRPQESQVNCPCISSIAPKTVAIAA
jgi:hypothetical protein